MRYRDYDQAGLDRQYNVRDRVPDFAAIVQRWARLSERARGTYGTRLDVSYGPTSSERLDLYLTDHRAGPAPRPLHIFIHGGYWQAMNKRDFGYLADGFVPAGTHVAAVGYALAPQADMDEIVRQCRASVAWLHRHAGGFNVDPRRISISGHSAGGHLVAMLLLTDWCSVDRALPERPLSAGVVISGLYDLEPIRLSYLNEALRLSPESAARNSPLRLLEPPTRTTPPPLVLCTGGAESAEFHRQQADFLAAWRNRGYEAVVVEAPGLDHFAVLDELAARDRPLNRTAHAVLGAPA